MLNTLFIREKFRYLWMYYSFQKPVTRWTDDECEKYKLQYYSTEIHEAAFVLPRFARKVGLFCSLILYESGDIKFVSQTFDNKI